MPTRKLTDLFAERVQPPEQGRIEYFDATFGGLSLRVTAQGNKSWSLLYRLGGRLRRLTLGQFPAIKPAQARREAGAALERVRLGIDPAEEKRDQRLASHADTFAKALEATRSGTGQTARSRRSSAYSNASRCGRGAIGR
jgi:Arm DNA-binding domain